MPGTPEVPDRAVTELGIAYSDGRASIDRVAAALDMHVMEAVALMEQHGFCRSVDRLRLTDEQRDQRLAAIRVDRLRRRGEPSLDLELVVRDVLASQRLEGIDALAWVPRL